MLHSDNHAMYPPPLQEPPNAIQAFTSLPSMRLTPLIHSAANTRLPNALHIETQPFQLGDIDDIASVKDPHGSFDTGIVCMLAGRWQKLHWNFYGW